MLLTAIHICYFTDINVRRGHSVRVGILYFFGLHFVQGRALCPGASSPGFVQQIGQYAGVRTKNSRPFRNHSPAA